MKGISRKIYLELDEPTEEDNRSGQMRIIEGLSAEGIEARMSLASLKELYPLCETEGWKVTVSLAWEGSGWMVTRLEAGDTSAKHYGLATDLGSTTVVTRLVDCCTGQVLAESGHYNRQIAYGTDILTRIFYCKDSPEALEKVRLAAVDTILENLKEIEETVGIRPEECIQMTVSGNTTMVHFLLGLDAFCVFAAPYAVWADQPGFLKGIEIGIPVNGYVFCYPGKSNYLGGDITSGLAAVKIYKEEELCIFFDIGTNGELVIGNREFLLCGAGAAGPALEGGVVRTGMRAVKGAVDRVRIENGEIHSHVLGEGKAEGICGSGIVDLLAELFKNGWIDLRGNRDPEKSPLIERQGGSLAVEYAPGLFFFQEDIDEFLRTKAAAYTMVEYMLMESGVSLDEILKVYVSGAFGKHVSKESAVTIGMYPDIDRTRLISPGNTSLDGAVEVLLDKSILDEIDEILDKMVYIQFGAVEDFLQMMTAALALPHTDLEKFPSVAEMLARRRQMDMEEGD